MISIAVELLIPPFDSVNGQDTFFLSLLLKTMILLMIIKIIIIALESQEERERDSMITDS